MRYDETNIKILTPEEVDEKLLFERIARLAKEYKTSVIWLTHLFEAAILVNVNEDYIIRKYLQKEALPIIPELQEAFNEAMHNRHMQSKNTSNVS